MADKHPYISSGGAVVQLLDQLKKSLPQTLNAEVLKKLSIAPSNESYALNVVRFVGIIDDSGKPTDQARKIFTLHDPATFQVAFSDLVANAYHELFLLRGPDSWTLSQEQLIPFFRQTDQSSALVGGRQAATFKTLAAYAGHGEPQAAAATRQPRGAVKKVQRATKTPEESKLPEGETVGKYPPRRDERVGLTVRIEVNLPAAGDQETYDRIFRSIKENLIDG